VQRLARDMLETMYAASAVGLAAPQVGVQKRVIVVDVGESPITLVNPEITAAEGEQVGLEGWRR
jgi:peptide deformylase